MYFKCLLEYDYNTAWNNCSKLHETIVQNCMKQLFITDGNGLSGE